MPVRSLVQPVVAAARALGWYGEVRWPVDFGGVTFAAVGTVDQVWEPGAASFAGCLVTGNSHRRALSDASMLAAYSPRAVVVPAGVDRVDLALQAALLDQGAVVSDGSEVEVVALPGPVVPSLLQWRRRWAGDERWLRFCAAVLSAAPLAD